jgi:Protein of unknown function (DUF1488)
VGLSSIAQPAHETIRGVKFAMRDGGALVSILVMHGALQMIEWSPPGSGDYLARFEKHRNRLEEVAIKKHLRGQVEDDGSVVVQRSDVQQVVS